MKYGSLNLLEPSGHVQVCNGIALHSYWPNVTHNLHTAQMYLSNSRVKYAAAGRNAQICLSTATSNRTIYPHAQYFLKYKKWFFRFSVPYIFYRLQNTSFQQMQPNIYIFIVYVTSHPTFHIMTLRVNIYNSSSIPVTTVSYGQSFTSSSWWMWIEVKWGSKW
jgi:hypothetical protein